MTTPSPQKQEDLDAFIHECCSVPDCKVQHEMQFISDCHPNAHVELMYTAGTGVLDIKCSVCKKLVTKIAVASNVFAFSS